MFSFVFHRHGIIILIFSDTVKGAALLCGLTLLLENGRIRAILTGMKNTLPVKAVISDLGRVFIDFDHSISCGKIAKLAGCDIEEVYDFIYRNKMDIKFDRGEISPYAFFNKIKARFKLRISYGEFKNIFSQIFTLIKPVYNIYRKLKKRYKLVFLSNTNVIHYEICLKTMPLKDIFEGGILSYKEGIMKPHPRLYMKAVSLAGCKPEECVYIDDIFEFVDAARALGLKGIRFKSGKQLERELKILGVK